MLKYDNRFHGSGPLRFVYKNGKAVRGHYFTLKFVKNSRRKSPRVAVVVSKKVLKSAVGRNRIRRRIYELFRAELDNLEPRLDVVCIVTSSEMMTMDAHALRQQLHDSFVQAGLYKNDQLGDTIE